MGYNTTVVILNDALGYIEQDPDFGKNLSRAVREVQRGKPVDVAARNAGGRGVHCNAATVIETHHADRDVLVRVGGNRGEVAEPATGLIEAARDAELGFRLIYEALEKRLYDEAMLHAGIYEARMAKALTSRQKEANRAA